MNIMISHPSPIKSARNLCLVHVNKQLQEGCQLLANAHHVEGTATSGRLCAPVQVNHPCSVWVRESKEHYRWLASHVLELFKLWREHSGKVHDYAKWFKHLRRNVPASLPDSKLVWPSPSTLAEWTGRNYLEDCFTTYQRYLSWKYDEWQTRTSKRRIAVKFLNGKTPAYYLHFTTLEAV